MLKRLEFGEKFEHQFPFSACHFSAIFRMNWCLLSFLFEVLSELAETSSRAVQGNAKIEHTPKRIQRHLRDRTKMVRIRNAVLVQKTHKVLVSGGKINVL